MMKKAELQALAEKVNDYWIGRHPAVGDCAWERGTYMLGNIAAYELTGRKSYLDYALLWADANGWRFYDDADYNTTNADNKICGQSYLRLLELAPGRGTDAHMLKSMEYTLNDSKNDYWWWVDTIYMALPYYTQMGVKYRDDRYFEKVHRLFVNSRIERSCYDERERLWYRDERFLPDRARTSGGEKVFWSRGNGWVFAGLARTLETMPEAQRYYSEYLEIFRAMAARLRELMKPDGAYATGLLDWEEFPDSETSGTALFTRGFLMGVRLGILEPAYLETALRGFEWLTEMALEENGRIGWVQTVAWGPGPVKQECANDYAVGTYLLILKELAQL